ncbi:MAG: methyltransferase type 11 [Bacilli bacterium]|nr:methyltransferase type 11 [Bacilli bacterium]
MNETDLPLKDKKLIRVFDRQAERYEKQRKKLQFSGLRRKLLQNAACHILEVSVGAGANFPFYAKSVQVTAVDISPKMIGKAEIAAREYEIQTDFIVSNLEDLHFAEYSFDTIISTLSFCGYDNPIQILQRFRHWCKPEGEILFFEHGKSSFLPIAWLQNTLDGLSVKAIGCHANRDILQMIKTAGIRIQRQESMMLGTVHLIWAKP